MTITVQPGGPDDDIEGTDYRYQTLTPLNHPLTWHPYRPDSFPGLSKQRLPPKEDNSDECLREDDETAQDPGTPAVAPDLQSGSVGLQTLRDHLESCRLLVSHFPDLDTNGSVVVHSENERTENNEDNGWKNHGIIDETQERGSKTSHHWSANPNSTIESSHQNRPFSTRSRVENEPLDNRGSSLNVERHSRAWKSGNYHLPTLPKASLTTEKSAKPSVNGERVGSHDVSNSDERYSKVYIHKESGKVFLPPEESRQSSQGQKMVSWQATEVGQNGSLVFQGEEGGLEPEQEYSSLDNRDFDERYSEAYIHKESGSIFPPEAVSKASVRGSRPVSPVPEESASSTTVNQKPSGHNNVFSIDLPRPSSMAMRPSSGELKMSTTTIDREKSMKHSGGKSLLATVPEEPRTLSMERQSVGRLVKEPRASLRSVGERPLSRVRASSFTGTPPGAPERSPSSSVSPEGSRDEGSRLYGSQTIRPQDDPEREEEREERESEMGGKLAELMEKQSFNDDRPWWHDKCQLNGWCLYKSLPGVTGCGFILQFLLIFLFFVIVWSVFIMICVTDIVVCIF